MHHPEELSQLRLVVETTFKVADSLGAEFPARPVARLPEGPGQRVELVAEVLAVEGEVVLVLAIAKKL